VEEERIKSAFEIAMERISDLPELTPEEIAAQNEKKYGPIGKVIAGNYVNGLISEDEMLAELRKHQGTEGSIVRRSLTTSLCRTLKLQADSEQFSRAIAGLVGLTPEREEEITAVAEEFKSLIREFEQKKQKKLEDFKSSFLQSYGISGTAVRVNPADNQYWREESKRLRQEYQPQLENLRGTLVKIEN
jgi:hypothetical protein